MHVCGQKKAIPILTYVHVSTHTIAYVGNNARVNKKLPKLLTKTAKPTATAVTTVTTTTTIAATAIKCTESQIR